jgi:hypothetical protein
MPRLRHHNFSQANRRPPISEKKWRAMGLLCVPTRHQLDVDPANGCCAKCGLLQVRKKFKYGVLALSIVVIMVVLVTFVLSVVTFLPH